MSLVEDIGPIVSHPLTGNDSPDPVLTGIMMAQTIKGIQSKGVMACAKHYIGNEQEHFRQAPESSNYGFNITDSLSSNIDDTTMHELYLWYVKRIPGTFLELSDPLQAIRRRSPSWCRSYYVLLPTSQQQLRLPEQPVAQQSIEG